MRKLFRLILVIAVAAMQMGASCRNTVQPASEVTVYVTPKGKKYHRENCRTIRDQKRAMTLSEAMKEGYDACKVCKPDTAG
jgi:hypothetical protein